MVLQRGEQKGKASLEMVDGFPQIGQGVFLERAT